MKELTVLAKTDNLDEIIQFVDNELESAECSMKIQMQVQLAVEEIFVNIANYAYTPEEGTATISVDRTEDGALLRIVFKDNGTPYDPLAKDDPDITLNAKDRSIGGLGIFITKKSMDNISYEYKDGQNVLTLEKRIVG
ncbi:ATP-binding protein [Ruminococcus sp. NK3A76]|uniref:ATP-binding protein n=1 Tax=Ruminococcus sp. NK3A76 TaxID=877411 RepID=UPI00048F653E|nr:ATP-binding protein [Ruminococcus sp. NK3A76]